jgi:hypothetical protein
MASVVSVSTSTGLPVGKSVPSPSTIGLFVGLSIVDACGMDDGRLVGADGESVLTKVGTFVGDALVVGTVGDKVGGSVACRSETRTVAVAEGLAVGNTTGPCVVLLLIVGLVVGVLLSLPVSVGGEDSGDKVGVVILVVGPPVDLEVGTEDAGDAAGLVEELVLGKSVGMPSGLGAAVVLGDAVVIGAAVIGDGVGTGACTGARVGA